MYSLITKPLQQTLASGALFLCAFYIPYAWPLSFVALVPFLFAIQGVRQRWHVFALGTLYGAIIAGGTSFWYFSATPIVPEMGSIINFFLILANWVAMTLALAPVGGLFALTSSALSRTPYLKHAVVPVAWVSFEFLRMYAFLFVTFAPGIDNPAFYSTGFIGYPLADSSSWLQLASMGGIYLMSFVVAGVNYIFFLLSCSRTRHSLRRGIVVALILILISVAPIVQIRQKGATLKSEPIDIGVMSIFLQEELSPGYKNSPYFKQSIQKATEELVADGAELILLPEGSRFFDITELATSSPVTVIDVVARRNIYGLLENVAYAGSPSGAIISPIRAKSILTPQGEYLIGLTKLFGSLFGYEEKIDKISDQITVSTARWGTALNLPGSSLSGSVLFCIEMIAPGFGAKLAHQQGSDFLLVPISQGRFKNPYTLSVDTLRFLKVRAVEAQRPVISSADHARAYVIDQYGKVIREFGSPGLAQYETIRLEMEKK